MLIGQRTFWTVSPMRLQFLAPALLLATAVAFVSCKKSGEEPATETPAPNAEGSEGGTPATDDAEPAAAEPGAPNIAWADKDLGQRKEFMGIYVLPKMRDAFKAHDGEQFGKFKCQTCHGDDMKEVAFKMPSDSLMPLPAEDPIATARDFDEDVTKFMVDEIMPQMGEMLGESVDATTGKGEFGCHACHPVG